MFRATAPEPSVTHRRPSLLTRKLRRNDQILDLPCVIVFRYANEDIRAFPRVGDCDGAPDAAHATGR
jgi:hypothetical protein